MQKELFNLLRKIPKGKVTTYGELAKALGIHPRKVGILLRKNPFPVKIPCHRVVCSNGSIGGYSLGIKKKIKLLEKEGVEIMNGKIDLKKFGFKLKTQSNKNTIK
jgi:methylated-DNA-[protein]-cysteine S-methyltransferase